MRARARFISPVERLMHLRALPLFGGLPSVHLAALAGLMDERRFRRGQSLSRAGRPIEVAHLLVDGEVHVRRRDLTLRVFHARDSVGLLALLAGDEDGMDAVALSEIHALELRAPALFDLLEDQFPVLHHLLRAAAACLLGERSELETPGEPEAVDIMCPARPLDLVERILILRRGLPIAESSPVALGQLARRARERRFSPGAVIWRAGAASDATLVPVNGAVVCEAPAGTRRVIRRRRLGRVEALAEVPRRYDAWSEQGGIALEVGREALLDVFEDHVEVGLRVLRELAAELLAALERRAAAGEPDPVELAAAS